MWADLNDAGDTGPLNSAGSSLLGESDCLYLTEVNSALQEESVIASPEVATLPDIADFPQDQHPHPLLLDL